MKNIILVDGNNLLFRSYYATAYSGTLLKNSKGFPTNALYGFISMINKIINEEQPTYLAVAFDIGKNFRKEKYSFYKEGRKKTPDELHMQEPMARQILDAMGIPYFELAPYEADDIIGTLAKMVEEDPDFIGTIISSDRDLLQLVSPQLEMKLLKQKDYIRYNPASFKEDYGIEAIKIIDMKALAGDSSDNIPGVKGIGEKTALQLLQQYGSLENIYNNIDQIKGKTKEKLLLDKDNAFISKELATIYRDVPLNIKDLEDIKYIPKKGEDLIKIYEELEFYSFLKGIKKEEVKKEHVFKELENVNELNESETYSLYLELDGMNYHKANILGMGIYDGQTSFYVRENLIKDVLEKIKNKKIYTYDSKKCIVTFHKKNYALPNFVEDYMIIESLLSDSSKDDIAFYMVPCGYEVAFLEDLYKKFQGITNELKRDISLKAKFVYENMEERLGKIKREEMYELYKEIELPLAPVLADMEITGMKVKRELLEEI